MPVNVLLENNWLSIPLYIMSSLPVDKENEEINKLGDMLEPLAEDSMGKLKECTKHLNRGVVDHSRLVASVLSSQEEATMNHKRMLEWALREQSEQNHLYRINYAEVVKKLCAKTTSEVTATAVKIEECS